MAKKKVSKKSKRRLIVFGTLSILMIFYFFYVIASYSMKLVSLKNEEKEINHKLAILQEEEEALKTEIEMLQDPEYIARYARENYLYSKDGEYIIKIDESIKEEEEEKEDKDYSSLIIGSALIGVFVVGLVLIKRKKKDC